MDWNPPNDAVDLNDFSSELMDADCNSFGPLTGVWYRNGIRTEQVGILQLGRTLFLVNYTGHMAGGFLVTRSKIRFLSTNNSEDAGEIHNQGTDNMFIKLKDGTHLTRKFD